MQTLMLPLENGSCTSPLVGLVCCFLFFFFKFTILKFRSSILETFMGESR